MDWYVINGELTDHHGIEVVRVTQATCYEEVIDMFVRDHPSASCINADVFRAATAKMYKMPDKLLEVTVRRKTEA